MAAANNNASNMDIEMTVNLCFLNMVNPPYLKPA